MILMRLIFSPGRNLSPVHSNSPLQHHLSCLASHVMILMRLIFSPGPNLSPVHSNSPFRFHPSCLASTRPDDPRSRPEQPRHRIRPPHGIEPDNSQPTNKVCAKKCGALKVDSDSRLWWWTGWLRRLCCREGRTRRTTRTTSSWNSEASST